MGVFIAVIIILILLLYAMKDLIWERDLSLWVQILLTVLILFTVILSIFMILHKGTRENLPGEGGAYDRDRPAVTESDKRRQEQPKAEPVQEQSDEEVMLAIAEEYVLIEDNYKKDNPDAADSKDVASNYIKQKYQFTDEEWNNFMKHAEENGLFDKARQKMKDENSDVNYVIAK